MYLLSVFDSRTYLNKYIGLNVINELSALYFVICGLMCISHSVFISGVNPRKRIGAKNLQEAALIIDSKCNDICD